MDMKTAFLNGRESFLSSKFLKRVSELQRCIYGLKHASHSWNKSFDEKIKEFGFIQNTKKPCVYMITDRKKGVFLILYVDDILMMENGIPMLEGVKSWPKGCFVMKYLGEVAYILEIKIYLDRSIRILGLSQSTHIDKILKRFKMENSKRGWVPITNKKCLSDAQNPTTYQEMRRIGKVLYASTMGSIMYVMTCKRRDVSYALSMTSIF
nr:hypothetical protein [Tanacetum cinerariifolium]